MLVLSWLLKAGLKQLGEACEIGAAMDCGNVLYVYMYVIERKEKKKKKPETVYSLNVPALEDSLKEVLQKCQYGRENGSWWIKLASEQT